MNIHVHISLSLSLELRSRNGEIGTIRVPFGEPKFKTQNVLYGNKKHPTNKKVKSLTFCIYEDIHFHQNPVSTRVKAGRLANASCQSNAPETRVEMCFHVGSWK